MTTFGKIKVILFCVMVIFNLYMWWIYVFQKEAKTVNALERAKSIWMKKLVYWEQSTNKRHKPMPIQEGRYLTWFPWEAGHNNRRISLELAYTFAYLTNRTLVLPVQSGNQYPFPKPILYETVYELEDMKSGVPTLTYKEYLNLPNIKEIQNSEAAHVNWTDIPTQDSCVGWPRLPAIGTEEWKKFEKWRYPRSTEGTWGHPHDPTQIKNFHTAVVLHFPHHVLFSHFYILFYFLEESPIQLPNITRLIRDHVHFNKEIMAYAALILEDLPESFSTIHYRRDDLQFEQNRWISPVTIYENSYKLFNEGEYIYVSTDEKPDLFEQEFCSVFRKRYKLLTRKAYDHLIVGIPSEWIPLVEMVILSQGRVFLGTRQSTFTGYVTRLRGYMPDVKIKDIYWSIKKYPEDYVGYVDLWKGWEREYPEAWETIKD